MTSIFRRGELHSLAAPYALDALEPREHRRFEKHLARCDGCAAEVRALREDAVRLAWSTAAPPPAALRDRVLTAIRTIPQEPAQGAQPTYTARTGHTAQAAQATGAEPQARTRGERAPSRARRSPFAPFLVPLASTTAAAALVVAALFGMQASRTQDRLDEERAQAREIAHVLAAPDARAGAGRDPDGQGIAVVASVSRRTAVVTSAGLAAPPGKKVHQLWLMRPAGKPRSLGLLAGDTPLLADGLDPEATSLAVTVEPPGGSARPTTAPVVQLALKSLGFGE